MTKTLTEQWKDGELELNSLWFVRLPCGLYDECFYTGSTIFMKSISGHDEKIWQVLAPVPSYDEFKDLYDSNKQLMAHIKTCEQQIERLQEQLKSANNAMKAMLPFAHNYPKERIEKYLKKWGVK